MFLQCAALQQHLPWFLPRFSKPKHISMSKQKVTTRLLIHFQLDWGDLGNRGGYAAFRSKVFWKWNIWNLHPGDVVISRWCWAEWRRFRLEGEKQKRFAIKNKIFTWPVAYFHRDPNHNIHISIAKKTILQKIET